MICPILVLYLFATDRALVPVPSIAFMLLLAVTRQLSEVAILFMADKADIAVGRNSFALERKSLRARKWNGKVRNVANTAWHEQKREKQFLDRCSLMFNHGFR